MRVVGRGMVGSGRNWVWKHFNIELSNVEKFLMAALTKREKTVGLGCLSLLIKIF